MSNQNIESKFDQKSKTNSQRVWHFQPTQQSTGYVFFAKNPRQRKHLSFANQNQNKNPIINSYRIKKGSYKNDQKDKHNRIE